MQLLHSGPVFRMEPLRSFDENSLLSRCSDCEISMIEKLLLETVHRLIDEKANLLTPTRKLAVNADLYGVGLTPFSAIQLTLALEKEFSVKFPERMLNRRCLSSINAICSCIRQLQEEAAQGGITPIARPSVGHCDRSQAPPNTGF